MKIYVAHSRDFDFINELYLPLRNSELNSRHEFILPHEHSATPYSSKELFKDKKVDLLLAEVSYPSTGLGIELGWANVYGIRIGCIYKDGAKVSGSVKSISDSIFLYKPSDLVQIIEQVIKSIV
jgi:hypothetical protein